MGLSNLFQKRKDDAGSHMAPASSAAPTPRVFHEDRARMFDLAQTRNLSELFDVPRPERKAAWQGAFFHALWTASLEVADPAVFTGPDGFPYLRLQLPQPNKAFESNSLANLARQTVESNYGAAIFASPLATEPEYVISMGVLDSLLTYDSWLGDPIDLDEIARAWQQPVPGENLKTITMEKAQQILVGTPSPALLPPHTAQALYLFLKDSWGQQEPRISLMINPRTAPTRNLVLSRKLSEFASPQEAGKQASSLLWYLPPHRSLILMPESWKQEDMSPLTTLFPA